MTRSNSMVAPDEFWIGTDDPEKKSGGSGDDFLIGAGGNDTLYGLAGNDQINAQLGADRIYGGTGQDRIYVSGGDWATGGRGQDTFVFLDHDHFPTIADPGTGHITDFDARGRDHDQLDLSGFQITWADRDAGLDDGFEMVKRGANVVLRLVCESGSVATLVLDDAKMRFLDAGDFIFAA